MPRVLPTAAVLCAATTFCAVRQPADISRKALEEEMRILYVAMTRARERLIVTAAVKDPSEYVNGVRAALRFDGEYTVLGASSYLSWILPALLSDGDGCGVKLVFAESAEENACV